MKLTFHLSTSETDQRLHPNGYWVAETDQGGYDGVGEDPMTAVAYLATKLEEALDESTESHM